MPLNIDKILIKDYELKTTMQVHKVPLLEIKEGFSSKCLFSRGNISTSTGQAKARKTFALTSITSAMLQEGITFNKFICRQSGLKIIYVLTEESKADAIMVGKRIQLIKGHEQQPENFKFFWLRRCSPSLRLEIIQNICNEIQPDFIVIDGIRDLVTDINNPDQATMVSTMLLKITDELNNHIHCVIHQNPGMEKKMRGHLGTELMNKSETILEILKDVDNKQYSIIRPAEMRGQEFAEFCFEIYENIPVLSDYIPIEHKKRSTKKEEVPF